MVGKTTNRPAKRESRGRGYCFFDPSKKYALSLRPSIRCMGYGFLRRIASCDGATGANLIELARFRMTDQGKSEKMAIVYQYLISTGFRQRVESIVEAFTTMKDDLDKEKQTIEKGWAKREKHLNLVLHNVSGMVGDIQAITPAFPRIKRLNCPCPSEINVQSNQRVQRRAKGGA